MWLKLGKNYKKIIKFTAWFGIFLRNLSLNLKSRVLVKKLSVCLKLKLWANSTSWEKPYEVKNSKALKIL